MAFDGNGTFNLLYTWATEAASPPIAISKLDTEMAGLATALSSCLLRNGTGKPTADIDWNAKKLTNLADATAATDALNRQTADARYAPAGAAAVTSGSFTAELSASTSGGTVLASGTAYYRKIGEVVTLRLPALAATTTSTTLYVRGFPAAIQPNLTGSDSRQSVVVFGWVNGAYKALRLDIYEGLAYWVCSAVDSDAPFLSSNTKKGPGGAAANEGIVVVYMAAD